MSILVTGGAGFVGANIIKYFLNSGKKVICIDNLSRGNKNNIFNFLADSNFQFINCDISEFEQLNLKLAPFTNKKIINEVWHLAANSDIPSGVKNVDIDFKDTFSTTYNIIKWMKSNDVFHLFFASSSAVYGDHGKNILSEKTGPLLPLSNYGAMKLASEALITAASESFLKTAMIFRFPNVVGIPATHGVIFDFFNKLKKNPDILNVLGDGTQKKSYLHVDELIDAMLYIKKKLFNKGLVLYNIGPNNDNGVTVKTIAEEVVKSLELDSNIVYGEGNKGWIGDVPEFNYSTEKLKKLGWEPKLNSHKTILKAISQIKIEIF